MTDLSRRDVLKAGAALALAPALLTQSSIAAADPYADAKFVEGEPPAIAEGSFTVAVLPDTQNYSEKFPENFTAQTTWLVENKAARNIACVLHLGDVTNHNSAPEWENAVKSLSVLDGKLPLFLVPGNHDYSEGGSCKDRTSRLSEYLPVSRFQDLPTFGGVYDEEPDRMENSFHLFEVEGREFIVFCLEFGPRKDVLRWAGELASRYCFREAILITHAHMYFDETRYNFKEFGTKQNWNPHSYPIAKATNDDVSDGEEVWNALLSKNENFILTLNGHVLGDGLGRLTSWTPYNRRVHQMLVNFQMKPNGGDGWLRLLEFQKDRKTVLVHDFSPTRKQCNASAQNQFSLTLSEVLK